MTWDPLRARVLAVEATVRDLVSMVRELIDRVTALERRTRDD